MTVNQKKINIRRKDMVLVFRSGVVQQHMHKITSPSVTSHLGRFELLLLTRGAPKVHYIPHTSLFLEKVRKFRDFVDTALLAHTVKHKTLRADFESLCERR